MRNRAPFLFTSCFGLGVVLLNAQNIVPTPGLESEAARVSGAPTVQSGGKATPAALEEYAKLPLSFERRGTSEFVARGQGYAMDIRGARATIAFPVSGVSRSSTIGMEFVHGRQVAATVEKELPGKVNYILGNDPRRWRLGLPTYERVTYHDMYPGIDVAYYGNQKQLEFDLVLKPGADVRSVRMRFSGAGKLHTDPTGSLMLGDLRLMVPTVIQGKNTIAARYKVLGSDEVAFEVGPYDRRQPLIIDPTLVYSTLLGGGNNSNLGSAIALDGSGNAYIAGYTYAADFPVANAAFAGYDANGDGFISKVNSTGTALIYSTYIGGSSFDYLRGIAVDLTGAAWAVGYTSSPDFPLLSPYQNTYRGGDDAVVVKLNAGGTLAYSTFLGSPGYDIANSVAVDPTGNAYVTGLTGAGFPTTAGVYQPVIQDHTGEAAFVTKFSSSGSLTWSTFVGGTTLDYANGIAVDEFGNSYISGVSYSTAFPGAPPGGAQPTNHGNGDAFVAKLNFTGSGLLYFTFLGGSQYDQANAIAVDPMSGIAVVAGQTFSADLSTSPGAVQSTNDGGYDGFVAKLNAAGSAFLYTTYLGGNRNDFIQGLAVDPSGNAYVAGYTDSNTFPTNAPIQSAMQGNSTSLFHTSNTGASWTPFDTNIPGTVSAVLPDPVNAGAIIVSTENGIYRTTNNGATWTQEFSGSGLSLSRSPANAATIYGVSGTAIYQSIDNGLTWTFKGALPQCCASEIQADPLSAGTAYAYAVSSSSFGIYKTVDGGATWSAANTGIPANTSIGAMAAGSDGSLYVGTGAPSGLYKSTNQGATWALMNNGLPPPTEGGIGGQGLAVAPTNPLILYAADGFYTLYTSINGGGAWTAVPGLPCGTNALAISSNDPATVYYAAWCSTAQMFVSTNSGSTWTPSLGLGPASIIRIVADPLNAAGAYAVGRTTHEAIIAKIDATGQNLLYSTYLGDGSNAFGIATNGTGDTFVTGYVAGSPYNPEFPVTPGALQNNRNVTDGFVARISDATAACTYTVDPLQSLETWYNHFVQYSVTAPSGCPWTASSDQTWATIASGASGSGSGVVWVLASSSASTTQSATLTIAGQSVTLRQRTGGCGYNSLSPEASAVAGGGGTVQFNVVVGAGCEWTITNNDPTAITIVSGASGAGNGIVTLNVAPNLGPNTRTFYVPSPQGDQETISQAGTTAPAVVSTITSSPSGASITVTGTGCIPGTYTTPASLTWNANTNCTINFATPQTIGGTPYTFYSATVNGGPSTTTNPLTVNSGTSPPTINANFLAPCTYSLTPSGLSFGASGGLGSFTVTTASTCGWTPTPSASWITILPSASKGTAKVNYAVASTTGGARAGTITVGGQTYNINQAAFSCSYSIGPSSASPDDTGGNVSVSVSAASGCAWTAVSNVSWVTVHSGASGSGGGVVVLTVAANTGGSRSGTATIAGQTFTVNQGAGACGALDETSALSSGFSAGGFQPEGSPASNLYYQQITITNRSGSAINGPLNYVLVGLPSSGTGTTGAWPFTYCFSATGNPIVPIAPGGLAAGQFVTFSVHFVKPPSGGPLSYTPKILSGNPSK